MNDLGLTILPLPKFMQHQQKRVSGIFATLGIGSRQKKARQASQALLPARSEHELDVTFGNNHESNNKNNNKNSTMGGGGYQFWLRQGNYDSVMFG